MNVIDIHSQNKNMLEVEALQAISKVRELEAQKPAHFIVIMYSFHNSGDGQKMLEAIGRRNITDAVTYIDSEQLGIIIESLWMVRE